MDSTAVFTVTLALSAFGLILGSFAAATVWRLRARQLKEDSADGYDISKKDAKQVSKLKAKDLMSDRSVCLHCGHTLAWYDLVPVVSWLSLRGKCRYCGKKIGHLEPAAEIGLAVFFVMSYAFWPQPLSTPLEILQLGIWLVSGTGLAILLIYDAKWFLLPDRVVYPLIGLAFVSSFISFAQQQFALSQLISTVIAVTILSGLYYAIYVMSNHKWIGFGDVKLGLVLALLLADWQLAVLALFLANAIGTVLLLPLMLSGKVRRQAHIPFGPMLIAGWFLAGLFGRQIIDWYLLLVLGTL